MIFTAYYLFFCDFVKVKVPWYSLFKNWKYFKSRAYVTYVIEIELLHIHRFHNIQHTITQAYKYNFPLSLMQILEHL